MDELCLGGFEERSHAAEIIDDLWCDEKCERLTLLGTRQLCDTLPVDPWSASSDVRDIVLEPAQGSQLRSTGLDMGLHTHESFNRLDRCRTLWAISDRKAHR